MKNIIHLDITKRERVMRDRNNPIEIYSEDEFRTRYTFSKSGFVHILNRVGDEIRHVDGRGLPLTAEKQLLAALRFYATGSYQRVAGNLIGVHVSTVCRTIQNVSKALVHLKNAEIVFLTQSEFPTITHDFSLLLKDNFPGIIEAIDCTHIPIQCPDSSRAQLFYNRISYYFINCQVICDGKMKIRNIVARWPGSTHDSKIFYNSSTKETLHQGYFEIPRNSLMIRICIRGYTFLTIRHITSDSGYPCLPYLITPFLYPQNHAKRRYNKAHSRARNIVERLFGVWESRFPCIGSCLRTKLDNTLNIIIPTAILHNWAIEFKEKGFLIEHLNEEVEEETSEMNEQSGSGSALRRSIVLQHFS
ncbi:putative nuclease HARBI1 [Centruroides sculpturatus]|uniref:putative nuclease HARBI1 n=1 Tax=Centruroides sculpturatus TaxID=218467 RepID=UPI000C6DD147|nr:putative nuclease HARBI1 [Centruroides sculpturatus]